MHPYATDSLERFRITAILAVLSLVITRATWMVDSLPEWSGFIIDLSAVGWFTLLFWLTNRFLWRCKLLRFPGLFQIPDVSGCWSGSLLTSYDQMSVPMKCDLEITQSWTHICVAFQTEHMRRRSSKSSSKAASLLLDQNGEQVLRYEYQNEPDPSRKEVLDIHWGTTKIVITDVLGNKELQGSYYTNRTPQTYGAFTMHRVA